MSANNEQRQIAYGIVGLICGWLHSLDRQFACIIADGPPMTGDLCSNPLIAYLAYLGGLLARYFSSTRADEK